MKMLGHNGGPTMEAGRAWRRFAWTKAREELLPTRPLDVVRMRVRRARELGLDYTAYASIRAASGHDVVALLFSSNALRVGPRAVVLPADRSSCALGPHETVPRHGSAERPHQFVLRGTRGPGHQMIGSVRKLALLHQPFDRPL